MKRIYLGLAAGVVATSFAAILIRLAQAPPLVIGAYRLGLAALILTPFALRYARRELRDLRAGEMALIGLSGLFLGLHFASWITSLEYTTVASSVALVATSPLFVGLASHFLVGEKVGRAMWVGLLISIAGGVIISLGDFSIGGQALLGDLLALLGALAGSGYFLLGRQIRQRVSLLAYVLPAYWVAGLVLLAAALMAGNPLTGYSPNTYLFLALLALIPQIMGHSLLNWTLKHLTPTLVTVSILAEPISSTILAFLILQETPTSVKLAGGALVLVGIYIAMRGQQRKRAVIVP